MKLDATFNMASQTNAMFESGEEMNVYGLYVSSPTLYYLIVEHYTSIRSFYASVDLEISSVQYKDLPINSQIVNSYLSSTLNFYYGYSANFHNINFGTSSVSYSNEVAFFMNLDLTNSCMSVSTNFYTPQGVSWRDNAFTYTK